MEKHLSGQHDPILDSINEGVFTIDLNWRITSFNRAAEFITGVKRKEAIGLHCSDVFRANICETACALKRTMEAKKPVVNALAYVINNAGNHVPIRISTALLKDDDGNVIGGVETIQDITQIEMLRKELEARYTFEDIIGRSTAMMRLFKVIPQIAESDSTVLIEGESGTGKELFARAIHNLSQRKKKHFVAINCAALPDTLLESELFGYEAGAFTDARKRKLGRFALADGGTLFLDEIGEISPAMQIRLLRVLQERTIDPLGSIKPVQVDVRVLAATNKDLLNLMRMEKFREDLFYRIRVIKIKLPRLKERREDIPLLVAHFVNKFNRLSEKDIIGVSDKVMARLLDYGYPGNVRELENIIEHAFVLCNGELIEMDHLPSEFRPGKSPLMNNFESSVDIKSMERKLIKAALQRHQGNRKLTAMELGINKSTLYRKIKSLKIDPPPTDGRNQNP